MGAVLLAILPLHVPAAASEADAARNAPASVLDYLTAIPLAEDTRRDVHAVYVQFGEQPIWTTRQRRAALIRFLVRLESHGIDPASRGDLLSMEREPTLAADVSATVELVRAAEQLARGPLPVKNLRLWDIASPSLSVSQVITEAVARGQIDDLFKHLTPQSEHYDRLGAALRQYRRLAQDNSGWKPLPLTGEVSFGADDPRTATVIERLTILGDVSTPRSAEDFQAGVRHFQARHGLDIDGRVGRATLAALNIAPAARARQLAVNMAYWRLLPREWPKRYVAVNTAAQTLDIIEDGKSTYQTRVIVGDPAHPTPVMAATISAVTFNPPWTIPRSIAVNEMLPRLKKNSDYLQRNHITIVDRAEDAFGLTVDWAAYSRNNFPFQLRQAPGPWNALGVVKFEMPNQFDVYLHDTSNRALFDRPERALSHGCVRVQCAEELAGKLLDDPSMWLTQNVGEILKTGETRRIALSRPLPVFLLYFTAFVGGGEVNFRPDLYGRDAVVAKALAAQPSSP